MLLEGIEHDPRAFAMLPGGKHQGDFLLPGRPPDNPFPDQRPGGIDVEYRRGRGSCRIFHANRPRAGKQRWKRQECANQPKTPDLSGTHIVISPCFLGINALT